MCGEDKKKVIRRANTNLERTAMRPNHLEALMYCRMVFMQNYDIDQETRIEYSPIYFRLMSHLRICVTG